MPQTNQLRARIALYCDFLTAYNIVEMYRSSIAHLGEGARIIASFDGAHLAQAGLEDWFALADAEYV